MTVNEEIILHLQPIYFNDGRVGYEVLSRGRYGAGADRIIREVIENRREAEFDLMIVEKTMRETSRDMKVAINILAESLLQENFMDRLDNIVSKNFRDRSNITLEINEGANHSDIMVKCNIIQFKSMGYKVSLDDYDGKVCSCEDLLPIKPHSVKFDKSLVGDRSIAQSIKCLNSLGIDTIIEGIESKQDLEYAKDLGYSGMQGFYLGKPMPVHEVMGRKIV